MISWIFSTSTLSKSTRWTHTLNKPDPTEAILSSPPTASIIFLASPLAFPVLAICIYKKQAGQDFATFITKPGKTSEIKKREMQLEKYMEETLMKQV